MNSILIQILPEHLSSHALLDLHVPGIYRETYHRRGTSLGGEGQIPGLNIGLLILLLVLSKSKCEEALSVLPQEYVKEKVRDAKKANREVSDALYFGFKS